MLLKTRFEFWKITSFFSASFWAIGLIYLAILKISQGINVTLFYMLISLWFFQKKDLVKSNGTIGPIWRGILHWWRTVADVSGDGKFGGQDVFEDLLQEGVGNHNVMTISLRLINNLMFGCVTSLEREVHIRNVGQEWIWGWQENDLFSIKGVYLGIGGKEKAIFTWHLMLVTKIFWQLVLCVLKWSRFFTNI